MTTCAYCGIDPPIENSHVVPAFVVRHIKDNNPEKFILNSWDFSKLRDGLKGPYLCAACDNVTFSGWENHFKKAVFGPVQAGKPAAWSGTQSCDLGIFYYATQMCFSPCSKGPSRSCPHLNSMRGACSFCVRLKPTLSQPIS